MTPLRVTVAGKGGTGKTVVAAVLARSFARRGHHVLAVDCDSNPMLAVSLGVPIEAIGVPEPIPTDFWTRVSRLDGSHAAVLVDDPGVLARRHGVEAPDGVTLLAGPVVPNEGCTSDAGVRAMLGALLGSTSFSRVITDFEAGVDEPAWALGGLLNPADVLLIVSTPSPVAIATAVRIARIAREAEIVRIVGIANQVTGAEDVERITKGLRAAGVDPVVTVPFDTAIATADERGTASPLDPGAAARSRAGERSGAPTPGGATPGIAALLELADLLEAEAAGAPAR